MIQSSLSNMALIFLMHLTNVALMNNRHRLQKYVVELGIVINTSICVILMFYFPIQYGDFFLDLRLVPLVMLTIRWGWKHVLPTLVITCSWRFFMGGEGMVPGIIYGMVLPVIFSIVFKYLFKRELGPYSLIILFTTTWLISDFPIIGIIPDGWNVFKEMAPVRLISYIIAALVYYVFIIDAVKSDKIRRNYQHLAEHDLLTGLYNKCSFEKKVKTYFDPNKKKYIVMIDIDFFKKINDTYGHLNGDHIIKMVSETIVEITSYSSMDTIVGRFGGEEFIVFFAADNENDMLEAVNNIHKVIEKKSFYTMDGRSEVHLTVSIGVSQIQNDSNLLRTIELADQSLFDSKKFGRNQINYADNINRCSLMVK